MQLASAIAESSVFVGELHLSQLRAMDDKRFPWLLLIPQRPDLEEWTDLSPEDSMQLAREISMVSLLLKRCTSPDKLNIATLGNVVRQLHIHVVARRVNDPAWPGPVWGFGKPVRYSNTEREAFRRQLVESLK